jgi:hypothetical protein
MIARMPEIIPDVDKKKKAAAAAFRISLRPPEPIAADGQLTPS